MKKLKFLTFALFAVLAYVSFVSCSDDKDGPKNRSIVGTWVERGEDDGEPYENTYIFKEDGSGETKWGQYDSDEFSYTYTHPTLTIRWDYGEKETLTVEWKGNNKIRLFDNDGEDFVLDRI